MGPKFSNFWTEVDMYNFLAVFITMDKCCIHTISRKRENNQNNGNVHHLKKAKVTPSAGKVKALFLGGRISKMWLITFKGVKP